MPCQLPPRLANGSAFDRDLLRARTRYYIHAAALYATEEGTVKAFCEKIGVSHTTIASTFAANNTLRPHLAIKIEQACGRDFITREMLRPDIYVVGAK